MIVYGPVARPSAVPEPCIHPSLFAPPYGDPDDTVLCYTCRREVLIRDL